MAIEFIPADELPKKLLNYLGKKSTDTLRGMALHHLWPNHLTASKFFKALVHPENHGVLDSYKAFIKYENPWQFVKDKDLLHLVTWLSDSQGGQWVMDTNPYVEVEWRGARHAILARLWQSLDNPMILKAFAGLVREKVSPYRDFTVEVDEKDIVQSDGDKRRLLAAFYVEENPSKLTPFHLLYAQNSLSDLGRGEALAFRRQLQHWGEG